jgi:ankyrin repeat protein
MSKSTPPAGWDVLGYAVWADQVAVVRELLDGGADPNGAVGGKTPLMEAVDEPEPFFDAGRLEMTVRLVEAGADCNRRDELGRTALHFAVVAGSAAIDALVAGGADVDLRSNDGRTPLHEAALHGNAASLEALLRRGADVMLRDGDGARAADLLDPLLEADDLARVRVSLGGQ